jgi:ABC-type iron transport system FetAB permease component
MNDTEPIRPTPDPKHTTELHWDNVIYGSGFICFTVLISVVLGLKLTKPLLISSTRCVVQLTLLGLVLENILNTDNVWLVLGLGLAFVILASFEIVQRKCKYQFFGMLPCVFLSLLFSCLSIGIIGKSKEKKTNLI